MKDSALLKLILFVLFVVISSIVTKAKRTQEAARRRMLEQRQAPARPQTARVEPWETDEAGEEDELDEEISPEVLEVRLEPVREPAAPSPRATPAFTPLPAPPRPKPALVLDRKAMKRAIVAMEVLGPPLALREDRRS